jgi:hypothetical protein
VVTGDGDGGDQRFGSIANRDSHEVTAGLQSANSARAELDAVETSAAVADERLCSDAARARPDERDAELALRAACSTSVTDRVRAVVRGTAIAMVIEPGRLRSCTALLYVAAIRNCGRRR